MTQENNLYALLIGINYYLPNKLSSGGSYGHLHGCVRDVEQMESFLKTRLGITDDYILKLTASHGGQNGPAEDPSVWPTYANIIAGFKQITEQAQPGDQVIVHYSGHGGRAKTIYPAEIKTSDFDEGFVPTDIGNGNGRYLRDLEFAHLLHTMSEKGLIVTVILDCCHSGGLTRGDALPRGISIPDYVDETERPTDTLAAADNDALMATWQQLTGGTRSASILTASDSWVVLTACRPQELAYEARFDGSADSSGALTYWLLKSLAGAGMSLSYKHLHQRVQAHVQARFSSQRPQLYGDGERAIFSTNRVQAQFAAPVMKVNAANSEVVINTGSVQGVQQGAQFVIFPLDATDLTDFDKAIAQVTITQAGATKSTAVVNDLTQGASIEPGAQAVLVKPASVQLRSRVRLQADNKIEGTLPVEAQSALEEAYSVAHSVGFLEWVAAEDTADLIVAANEGFYEIWDATGTALGQINPPLALSAEKSAAQVIARLIHLTRYRNVQQLANTDSRKRGTPQITFEWLDSPVDRTFAKGDVARLLVRNNSSYDVEITILDLGEDWQIKQVYPETAVDSYPFAPKEEDILEFDVEISADNQEETNIYKLFATIQGTNFHMLELPSLDAPLTRGVRSPTNALEELLSQAVETAPSTRTARLRTSADRQWTTAQVELRVRH